MITLHILLTKQKKKMEDDIADIDHQEKDQEHIEGIDQEIKIMMIII